MLDDVGGHRVTLPSRPGDTEHFFPPTVPGVDQSMVHVERGVMLWRFGHLSEYRVVLVPRPHCLHEAIMLLKVGADGR